MKANQNAKFVIGAIVFLGVGFFAGRASLRTADEGRLVFASYGKAVVRGDEVLPRIQTELDQLERSKYALKKSASEELLKQRLSPEERAELQALSEYENQRPAPAAAVEVTKDEVEHYMREKKYDAAKIGPQGIEGLRQTLAAEKAERLEASQKQSVEKAVNFKRIHYGIPRTRGATVKIPKATAESDGSSRGSIDVILVSNATCPTCAVAHRRLAELKHRFPNQLKISFLLQTGDGEDSLSHMAGEAALCANEQKQFWKYEDLLFAKTLESERDLLLAAYTAKLDTSAFEKCFRERRFKSTVAAESEATQKAGIQAPAFVINGEVFSATESLGTLSNVIDSEL